MSRVLTGQEIKLARQVFKTSISYPLVRVHDEKYIFFQPDDSGMTPNGEIYVDGVYSADYSTESPGRKGFFIHEMVHVWQHQNGILNAGVMGSAILEIIGRGGDYDSAYPYVLESSKDLTDYGIEQQASIVEDYVRLTKLALMPRRARLPYSRVCTPSSPNAPTARLYETVLRNFLRDPTYGNHPYQRVCAPN